MRKPTLFTTGWSSMSHFTKYSSPDVLSIVSNRWCPCRGPISRVTDLFLPMVMVLARWCVDIKCWCTPSWRCNKRRCTVPWNTHKNTCVLNFFFLYSKKLVSLMSWQFTIFVILKTHIVLRLYACALVQTSNTGIWRTWIARSHCFLPPCLQASVCCELSASFLFYYSRIKKGEGQGQYVTISKQTFFFFGKPS